MTSIGLKQEGLYNRKLCSEWQISEFNLLDMKIVPNDFETILWGAKIKDTQVFCLNDYINNKDISPNFIMCWTLC